MNIYLLKCDKIEKYKENFFMYNSQIDDRTLYESGKAIASYSYLTLFSGLFSGKDKA